MATASQTWSQQQDVAFGRILIATDFSENSHRALRYALTLAHQYGSEVYVVHATPAPPHEPIRLEPLPRDLDVERLRAEQQMKHFVEAGALGGVTHYDLLEQGPVVEVLSSLVKREQIDLLVLGTHGRGGLKKLVLGSVAERMLRLVPCPVLTVGQNAAPEPGACGFERILFVTDFGVGAAMALPYAVALAEKYGAKLILAHMVQPLQSRLDTAPAAYGPPVYLADELVNWEQKQRQQCMAKLEQLLRGRSKFAQEPEYVVGVDSPVEGILRLAAWHKVQLIVMGANRTRSVGTAAHVPWGVAHRVICEGECPVLTVRG